MRALRYFFAEALASLGRGWRAATLSILTIAAGLFVLGLFLIVNTNLQRLVNRWSESAELSIYLRGDATGAQVKTIDELIAESGLTASRHYVSTEEAAARFRQDFPDLAPAANGLGHNPFPASFEVRLRPEVGNASEAVDALVTAVSALGGVADVQYDRRWLTRLNTVVRAIRGLGLLIVILLAIAAALTVSNVVRLTAAARRDEIEIMQLVGAPHAYVRGPFIAEGVLQGGIGAILALVLLWAMFMMLRVRYGQGAAEAAGLAGLSFLPVGPAVAIVAGGMILGCLGALVVARDVR